MQYRSDRKGTKLSVLGYGCLRFTKENGKIDIDKTEKEIMEAIRSGVNYFDTAYVYGGSEAALGEILARNGVREQVYIATKLPHYLIKSKAGLEKCFQEQLKRLRTDHVDYYLMHMLNDVQTWQGLCAKGVDQWIREKQASGQIGSIGFSYHGNSANFKELLDEKLGYPAPLSYDDWVEANHYQKLNDAQKNWLYRQELGYIESLKGMTVREIAEQRIEEITTALKKYML